MSTRWTQTPDGHGTSVQNPDDSAPDAPAAEREGLRQLPVLRRFLQACLAALPESPRRPRVRLGLCIFLLGAADRLWSRIGLDDRSYPAAAEALLQELGVGAEEAAALVTAVPQLAEDGFGRDALLEGARTFDDWYLGADANSVLVLRELAARWAAGDD